jgi:hypothetical protein
LLIAGSRRGLLIADSRRGLFARGDALAPL